jgi:hypothetical protein
MKRLSSFSSSILAVGCLLLLSACSSEPVRTETESQDIDRYRNAFVADVVVRSTEDSANARKENREVERFARAELRRVIEESRYRYLPARPTSTPAAATAAEPDTGGDAPMSDELAKTLAVSLDMHITWGSRALRYLVGFGAGKGRISSTLTVEDAATGAVKYRSSKDSMLAMGLFGGSMEPVVRENIADLLANYPGRP